MSVAASARLIPSVLTVPPQRTKSDSVNVVSVTGNNYITTSPTENAGDGGKLGHQGSGFDFFDIVDEYDPAQPSNYLLIDAERRRAAAEATALLFLLRMNKL